MALHRRTNESINQSLQKMFKTLQYLEACRSVPGSWSAPHSFSIRICPLVHHLPLAQNGSNYASSITESLASGTGRSGLGSGLKQALQVLRRKLLSTQSPSLSPNAHATSPVVNPKSERTGAFVLTGRHDEQLSLVFPVEHVDCLL